MNRRVFNAISGRLSLRLPQAESLERLTRAIEAAPDLLAHQGGTGGGNWGQTTVSRWTWDQESPTQGLTYDPSQRPVFNSLLLVCTTPQLTKQVQATLVPHAADLRRLA